MVFDRSAPIVMGIIVSVGSMLLVSSRLAIAQAQPSATAGATVQQVTIGTAHVPGPNGQMVPAANFGAASSPDVAKVPPNLVPGPNGQMVPAANFGAVSFPGVTNVPPNLK